MDASAQSAEIVRTVDRDRYLADLFAPSAARPHLFALHAFNSEVARIRDSVSLPVLGEIRLQWWHDALHGDPAGHPLATALKATIAAFRLPLEAFDNLLEARKFDLYDDPMPSLNDLEGYAGETSSALMQLAAIILAGGNDPGTTELSGHGGVAYALAGLLGTFRHRRNAGNATCRAISSRRSASIAMNSSPAGRRRRFSRCSRKCAGSRAATSMPRGS